MSFRDAASQRVNRRKLLLDAGAVVCAGTLLPVIGARKARAAWPDRPIRLVVPFAAGGPPDFVARALGDPLGRELGGSVIVENKPGAGGTVGVTSVARADPDGYTLLICTSAYILNKALNEHVQYDPVKDFTPICEIASAPNVFVVNAKLGVGSLKEFIALAQSRPNGVNYASPGTGTTPQLSSELLRVRAKIPMVHIPYNSGPQVVQSLLTDLVQITCTAVPLVQAHIGAGTLKALAVTSNKRWRGLPDVPTMAELGFDDFVLDTMVMLAAPAGLPAALTAKLDHATQVALARPALRSVLEGGGFDVVAKGPAELAQRIAKEVTMWRNVVAETTARPR